MERWHSSTINTMRLACINLISAEVIPPSASSLILLIFWIEVTISVSVTLLLFNLLTSTPVFSVDCTLSASSAKPRYCLKLCVPSSILSIKNTTLSASLDAAISWADLKLVIVLPLPVVCQI